MSKIQSVVEFPEEGFAILEDDAGRFVAFKDREEIVELKEFVNPVRIPVWPFPVKNTPVVYDY